MSQMTSERAGALPVRGRSRFYAGALTALLLLTVAACGGSGSSPQASGSSGSGGGGKTIGDTLTIPYLADITGPAASAKNEMLIPAQMVVDEINKASPQGVPKLKIKVYDSQEDPAQAIRNFQTIKDSNPVVVVGSYSATANPVAPVANDAGIPFIAGFTSVISIATDNRPNVFAATPDIAVLEGNALKSWQEAKPSVKRVVVIEDTKNVATSTQGDAAVAALKKLGMSVAGTVSFETGATNLTPLVQKAAGMHPDGVIIAALAPDMVALSKTVKQQGLAKSASVFLLPSGLNAGFFKTIGDDADGYYGGTFFYPGASSPATVAYVNEFKKRSGGSPPGTDLEYTAWKLLAAALTEAKVQGMTVDQARAAVRDALTKASITGATGKERSFNSQGYEQPFDVVLKLGNGGSAQLVASS